MVSPGNTAGEQIPILDLTQPAAGGGVGGRLGGSALSRVTGVELEGT